MFHAKEDIGGDMAASRRVLTADGRRTISEALALYRRRGRARRGRGAASKGRTADVDATYGPVMANYHEALGYLSRGFFRARREDFLGMGPL